MKQIPQSFKQAQIAVAQESKRLYLLLGVEGETGTGKSEIALSVPDPAFGLNYDNGLRILIDKHIKSGDWKDKVIGIHHVKLSPTINQAKDLEVFKLARSKFLAAAKDPAVKSLFIDTGKQLWEHIRRAEFGKLLQVPQYKYPGANASFRWFIDIADHYGKNLVITWPMGDEYVKSTKTNSKGEKQDVEVKTGRRIRSGKGDAEEMVEAHIHMSKDILIPEAPDKFSILIKKCRQDTTLEGVEISGMEEPECFSFLGLAQRIYPESSKEDWL